MKKENYPKIPLCILMNQLYFIMFSRSHSKYIYECTFDHKKVSKTNIINDYEDAISFALKYMLSRKIRKRNNRKKVRY